MKAEERKHLETNTLAEGLGKLAQGLQQGIPKGFWLVLGGVAVVVVLFWIWRHFSDLAQARNASLWVKWDQTDSVVAIDPEVGSLEPADRPNLVTNPIAEVKEKLDLKRLETFAKDNPNTIQGRLARFQLARLFLYEGLRDLGREPVRAKARERLKHSAKLYGELVKDSRDITVLHQEALLNCAKANESLGELTEARDLYKQLQTTYPKSDFGRVAEEQLKRLERDATDVQKLDKTLQQVPESPTSIK